MLTRRWLLIPLAMMLCAQTRPATAPATAPATGPATTQSADGEIRQVVLKMLVAMREGERAKLLALCYTEDATQKKSMEAVMDLGLAAHKANKIALARWGQAGDIVFDQFASEREYKHLTEAMSKGAITLDGNSARLEPAATEAEGDDVDVIFLKRVGGRWLLDFSKMLEEPAVNDPAVGNKPFVDQMNFLKNTVTQLGADIEAGKYKRPQDAKAVLDKAVDENAKKLEQDADKK